MAWKKPSFSPTVPLQTLGEVIHGRIVPPPLLRQQFATPFSSTGFVDVGVQRGPYLLDEVVAFPDLRLLGRFLLCIALALPVVVVAVLIGNKARGCGGERGEATEDRELT